MRYFSAVKEYDLAVIGGGPGGKPIYGDTGNLLLFRLCRCNQSRLKRIKDYLYREKRYFRRYLLKCWMHPIKGFIKCNSQVS